jgi:hypothetical protein
MDVRTVRCMDAERSPEAMPGARPWTPAGAS